VDRDKQNPGKTRFMRSVLIHLRRYLITGIVVSLPAVVTLWVLWNMFSFLDGLAKRFLVESIARIPGVGVVLFFSVIILVGVFATNIMGKRLISFGERIMNRIPLANRIYKAVQQISNAFIASRRALFDKVVIIEYPRKGIYSLGFITSEVGGEVQYKTAQEVVGVFVPTTPNPTSGMLVFVPREDVIQLDMSTEDGLKMVISGGLVTPAYFPPTPQGSTEDRTT
jgi:uncharacterized membrane protein